MKDLKYAKGGKVIIQPNDYNKYKKIGIENKYYIETFNDIGLSGINFDSVTLNNLLEKKFNELLESYKDYVISEDSQAITTAIQNDIDARKREGDSLERIKEYEAMLTNQRDRVGYIKNFADNQLKTLSEWVSYLKQSEYSIAFKYLLLKAVLNYNYDYKLNKLIERNNKKSTMNFVGFDAASLAELNQLNSDFLLKDYTQIQANNAANVLKSKDVIKSDNNGKWIKFNGGKKTNEEERIKNAKELSQLVQNTYWCTKTNSKSQLNGGDFYVYVTETDGEVFSRIAIRMDEGNVGEVRGNKSSAQDIEEEMLPIAEDFLVNNIPNNSGKKWLDSIKYNSSVIAFKEKLIAEGTLFENSIEIFFDLKGNEKKYLVDYAQSNGNVAETQNIIEKYVEELEVVSNLFYKKSDFGNINSELYGGSRYSHFITRQQKYFFGSYINFFDIDILSLAAYNLEYILGDAIFGIRGEPMSIFYLGNLKLIGGNANFENSEVENLGNLTTIGGYADFRKSKIKNLGNLTTIGVTARFEDSQVENLGKLTTIGGDANFQNSLIKDLGNLTTIGGSAYFNNSQVENLGNLKRIERNVNFRDSKVKDLSDLTTINGYADFRNSQVENLGNLTTINGDANFRDSKVKDLGNLTSIGKSAEFRDSQVENLGNLTTIGGDADFRSSQVENLGNLTTINGSAYFKGSELMDLGNLTTIGLDADFSLEFGYPIGQIKSLGNLTKIGRNAYFTFSEIENLGNLKYIGGDFNFEDTIINNLGNLTTIGGDVSFSNSKIKSLGNLKTIGGNVAFGSFFGNNELKDLGDLINITGDAYFQNSKIINLGNLTLIGGNADFENSQVENLGNLTTIYGNAIFSKSKIKNLGNLTTINGNAIFSNSEVKDLGNLTTIKNTANFKDSKIINLGNLRSVNHVEGKTSIAYKLWIKRVKDIQEGKFENGGYLISDSLSSQEVEYKLGRELHWWNDDIVYLSGIKYKKVYLRPEYKKVIE